MLKFLFLLFWTASVGCRVVLLAVGAAGFFSGFVALFDAVLSSTSLTDGCLVTGCCEVSKRLTVVALLGFDIVGVVWFFALVSLEAQQNAKSDGIVCGFLVTCYHPEKAGWLIELKAIYSVRSFDSQSLVLQFLFDFFLR